MSLRKDYIKIRTSLALNHKFDLTAKGFSQEFIDRLNDSEEGLRERIMLPINNTVGLHNWAIHFIENPSPVATFFCDIYVDDKIDYQKVVAIVKNVVNDVEFDFSYKGTVHDYLRET